MKRFLCLLIALTIVFSVIGVSADSAQLRRLTLEEAKQMAIANSIKYQLQDSYISDALETYYDTVDSSDKMKGSASSGMMNYFNKTITPEISVDSTANSVKLARFEKTDIKRASDYNVEMAFINIKKAQLEMDNKQKDTVIKEKDYNTAKLKRELGLITESALKDAANAYSDSIAAQHTALSDLRSQYQTLNKYIGRAVEDYNIEIVYELPKHTISDIDVEQIKTANLKNNKSFYSLQQTVALAQRKYDLTKERLEHFEKLKVTNSIEDMRDAFYDAERDYTNARQSFEDATKELDISLNTSYNSLKNTLESADRLERNINIFKDELNKMKLQYELGLMSKNDYEKQQTTLSTMQNSLNSLLADINKQYVSLMLYAD